MNFYKSVLRPVLFSVDPEIIHDSILYYASELQKFPLLTTCIEKLNHIETKPVQLWNLTFPNRVGLAAGFDKNAMAPWFWYMLGFGFIEIGGITQFPQPGNDKPRIFRLKKDEAIINRMGFNNDGVEVVRNRLENWYQTIGKPNIPIGVNIGKNKKIPNEQAPETYRETFRELYPVCDFFVVNVSSPNTPNLRKLQDGDSLRKIFDALFLERKNFLNQKPLLLKIAPDLSQEQLSEIINLTRELHLDGLVISNTTLARQDLKSSQNLQQQTGGLSGKPVKNHSTDMIRFVKSHLPDIPIIGVGGIFSPEDAIEKLNAGADLVQLYTGFIYEGPGLVKRMVRSLTLLEK